MPNTFGLAQLAKQDEFKALGSLPVTFLQKKDLMMSFLDFEEMKLRPIVPYQPAALLRPLFDAKIPEWTNFSDWCVSPKTQNLFLNKNGLGKLEEAEGLANSKLGEFFSSNSDNLPKLQDEGMFKANSLLGVKYVNDIHLEENLVKKGDYWQMFTGLGLEKLGSVSGVSSPWGYAATRMSTFPLHLEDSNLGSINLLLDGKPKIWFVIHPNHRDALIRGLRKLYPEEFKKCTEYHRHKSLFLSPIKVMNEMGIPVYRIDQRPGDLVVTWPGTFHWGYNAGVNASMAVNYCPRGEATKLIVSTAKQCSPKCKIGPTIFLPTHKLFETNTFPCIMQNCTTKSFATPQGLIKHIKNVHNQNVKMADLNKVPCPKCDKNVKKLGDHLKRKHKKEKEECNLCGASVYCRKKHWLDGCRKCQFCKKNGIKKNFNRRNKAWLHFDHH